MKPGPATRCAGLPTALSPWTLPLSARGGHEHNGVYQFLFSANGNDDWGYCAINGQPGRLAGGCGYSSRLGRISKSAVVIRVLRDADYTIVVFPDQYRYAVTPRVESLQRPAVLPGERVSLRGTLASDGAGPPDAARGGRAPTKGWGHPKGGNTNALPA